MSDNKKIITILTVFTIIFTIVGGSLAYWTWDSEFRSNLAFTLSKDFSCSADGGKDITPENVQLAPTKCTDTARAIKREINVTPTIKKSGLSINLDMWLKVDSIDNELSDSKNLRYVLTTSGDSCETGIVAEGNFNGVLEGNKVGLLNSKQYSYGFVAPDTYYLWIWLDEAESNNNTMDKSFKLSLGGECTDSPYTQPEKPVLDPGMIPVTISDSGVVTTVQDEDRAWYDYDNQKWANVVLVNDSSRSKYKNTTNITVSNNDILAHYVWIPRYKYKIVTCGDIDGITEEEYPECYGAPYVVSDEDRKKMIDTIDMYWDDNMNLAYYEYVDIPCESCHFYEGGCYDGWVNDCFYDVGASFIDDILNNGPTFSYKDFSGNTYTTSLENELRKHNLDIEYQKTFLSDGKVNKFEIEFENKTDGRATGDAVNTYYTHPAFWWDNDNDNIVDSKEMLAGIWVGKFETTGSAGSPTIKPNVKALYNQNVADQFNTAKKFSTSGNIYGISNTGTNAHMMKNSEWGAVAYFTHSKYGIGMNEVQKNNNNSYITGCAGAWNTTSENCESTYYSGDNQQSTTHNISGIYDMSGGIYEYVMGNYNNVIGNSGFTKMPDRKYYNLYTTTSLITNCTLEECGGHALYETAGWNDDSQNGLSASSSWYLRGGYYDDDYNAGIFATANGSGINALDRGFRSVIINGFGQ